MPTYLTRAIGAGLMLAALAGCDQYTLVPAAIVTVKDTMVVEPAREWSRVAFVGPIDTGRLEVWTIDGETLHQLLFVAGVEDGQPLFNARGKDNEKPPVYRAGMSREDVASLFEAAFTRAFDINVFKVTAVKPQAVGGGQGIRVEFTFTAADEVDRDGVALATQEGGKLYLVAYQGPRLLYQARYAAEVERVLTSVRLKARS